MNKVLLVALFFNFAACAQKPESKMLSIIKNSKTERHINIPGTRVYMVPPTGFNVTEMPAGLKSETGIISIMDLIDASYAEMSHDFSKESMETEGTLVDAEKQVTVNGYPGKFITYMAKDSVKIYSLMFGDTSFTVMVQGIYTLGDEKAATAILEAFNTIWYDTSMNIDPMDNACFTIDLPDDFYLIHHNDGVFTFSTNDESSLTIIEQGWTGSVKVLGHEVMQGLSDENFITSKATDLSAIQVNGRPTYEALVEGTVDGQPARFYIYMVGDGIKAVVFKGLTEANFEEQVKVYQKMAHTIRLK